MKTNRQRLKRKRARREKRFKQDCKRSASFFKSFKTECRDPYRRYVLFEEKSKRYQGIFLRRLTPDIKEADEYSYDQILAFFSNLIKTGNKNKGAWKAIRVK